MVEPPKRPMSAYMLWLNATREQIKAENPGMKDTDIAKKGGEIWKSIDKSEWEEKAAKAKEQYEKELQRFERSQQQ